MATLEITKKRIKVVGLPEEDDRHWFARLLSTLFKKPNEDSFAPAQTHVLLYFSSVMTASKKGRKPVYWQPLGFPIEIYSREQKYWELELRQPNGTTGVIASWDRSEIERAYDQVDAAINGPDDFSQSVHIENANIVIGSKVEGNIENKVQAGDGTKKES